MQETQETWFGSLGQGRSLEKEMATHSSVFAWKIQWTEEPGGLQFMGLQRVRQDWTRTHHATLPTAPSTFVPDQTQLLQGLLLEPHPQVPQVPTCGGSSESALEVLLVPAWEPGCLCFAALSWQGAGKQQVAMCAVCSWTGSHVITTSSPCHLQCGSLLGPCSKLRFTSLKEELGHCWTLLISAKARCIFSWGLWHSAPKWSLFNKGISSNWILKMKLWILWKGNKRGSGLEGRGEAVFWASMMYTLQNSVSKLTLSSSSVVASHTYPARTAFHHRCRCRPWLLVSVLSIPGAVPPELTPWSGVRFLTVGDTSCLTSPSLCSLLGVTYLLSALSPRASSEGSPPWAHPARRSGPGHWSQWTYDPGQASQTRGSALALLLSRWTCCHQLTITCSHLCVRQTRETAGSGQALFLPCSGASCGQIQPSVFCLGLNQFGLPYLVNVIHFYFLKIRWVHFSYVEPDASGTGAVEDGFL